MTDNTKTRYAEIPEIRGGIVFSDPSYDENVWCQYRKAFDAKNWLMKLDTHEEEGYIHFDLTLARRTLMTGLQVDRVGEYNEISFPERFDHKQVEIGIDTACVYVGSMANLEVGEEAAIYTGSDGLFGDLNVFTCIGEEDPAGFFISSAVDSNLTSDEYLFTLLTAALDGKEISRFRFDELTDRSNVSLLIDAAREDVMYKSAIKENTTSAKDLQSPDRE